LMFPSTVFAEFSLLYFPVTAWMEQLNVPQQASLRRRWKVRPVTP
jgi:hypothetical protein